jgi:arginyl-tRNA synthetase
VTSAADPIALLRAPLAEAVAALGGGDPSDVALERPADAAHGDYATTLALRLTRELRRPPREIAEELRTALSASPWVDGADVAGPGFVNLRVAPAWYAEAVRLALGAGYGGGTAATSEAVNVEFVSANPTGLLTVGSGRNAAYGDSVARLLIFAGHRVTREYYFNDTGAQIDRFGGTLRARARGEPVPEDGYPSEEVAELARELDVDPEADAETWARAGVPRMFAAIRATLERVRVHMDVFTNEADLHAKGIVATAWEHVLAGGHAFERDGAQWLRTTDFGDDKDRVVFRADGRPTYLASDIGYMDDKLGRGFDRALFVLGADHHGYAARLQAAASALGWGEHVEILLYQLVTISERGVERKISKRRGDVVLLDDLVDAIGVDATRYYLVQRSHDQTMDIDLELAREHSQKNPVYYVQYAHARIASIMRRAGAEGGEAEPVDGHVPAAEEAVLIRRLAEFPAVSAAAADMRAPHRIVAYATDLAADFHVFYRECSVLNAPDPVTRTSRLALCRAASAVLARSLDLIGVSAPEEM